MQLVFVGQSYSAHSGTRGISILFSAPLAVGQPLNQAIQVSDHAGRRVNKDWLHSRNPRSIYMPGLAAGKYHIRIEPVLKGRQGQKLTTALQGSVSIR